MCYVLPTCLPFDLLHKWLPPPDLLHRVAVTTATVHEYTKERRQGGVTEANLPCTYRPNQWYSCILDSCCYLLDFDKPNDGKLLVELWEVHYQVCWSTHRRHHQVSTQKPCALGFVPAFHLP